MGKRKGQQGSHSHFTRDKGMPSPENVRNIQKLLHQNDITIQQKTDIISHMDIATSDVVRICGLKARWFEADDRLEEILLWYTPYHSRIDCIRGGGNFGQMPNPT
jgi:hypothetical protein